MMSRRMSSPASAISTGPRPTTVEEEAEQALLRATDPMAALWATLINPLTVTVGPSVPIAIIKHPGCGIDMRAGPFSYFSRKENSCGEGSTPLHLAVLAQRFDVATFICQMGADVNATDSEGSTALHLSCGLFRAIERALMTPLQILLLLTGANPMLHNGKQLTPLHLAVKNRHLRALATMLEGDVNINVLDGTGVTPLQHASLSEKDSFATLLLEHGAALDPLLHTLGALSSAVTANSCDSLVKALIDNGADVDEVQHFGWTPLHQAALVSNSSAALILLREGCNVSKQDSEGRTPSMMAIGAVTANTISAWEKRTAGL